MKPFEEIAVAFAAALVAKEFERARAFLTPALRSELSARELQELSSNMYRRYADSEPCRSELVPEGSLETWPAKQPGDLGLAYVSIEGEDFNEAVYVLVREANGLLRIGEIQWGRP